MKYIICPFSFSLGLAVVIFKVVLYLNFPPLHLLKASWTVILLIAGSVLDSFCVCFFFNLGYMKKFANFIV